jgi:hypothetical protein
VLQRSFARAHPEFALDIEPLAPEAAVRKSLQAGDVKKVCLIRYGVPETLEDKYQLGSHVRNMGTVEIVVRPPRGSSFRKQGLMRLLESDDRAGLLEWNGATYTDMKVEVKIGRRHRTLTVTSDKAPRVTFPVPDDAAKDPAGRPTDHALYEHAMQIAADLGADLGFPPESFAGTGFTWTPEMTCRRVAVVSDED